MINSYINGLVNYAVEKGLIDECDSIYARNRVLALLKLDDYKEEDALKVDLCELLKGLCDYAVEKGLINDSITERDIFDTELMAIFTDRPSSLIKKYNELYKKDPMLATDWYYNFSCNTNYIRRDRIAKDVKWKTETEYGTLSAAQKDLFKTSEDTQIADARARYSCIVSRSYTGLNDFVFETTPLPARITTMNNITTSLYFIVPMIITSLVVVFVLMRKYKKEY